MKEYVIRNIFINPFKKFPCKVHVEYIDQHPKDENDFEMSSFTLDYKYNTDNLDTELDLQSFKILYDNSKDKKLHLDLKENPKKIIKLIGDYMYSKSTNYLGEFLNIINDRDHSVIYAESFDGYSYRQKDYQYSILEYINKIL